MKRTGFTLIELVGVISIMIMTFVSFNISKKYFNDYKEHINDQVILEEIIEEINNGRALAIESNRDGTVVYDIRGNKIIIDIYKVARREIKLKENYKATLNVELKLKKNGAISAGTLKLTNKINKKIYILTIGVGLEIMRFYEEEG